MQTPSESGRNLVVPASSSYGTKPIFNPHLRGKSIRRKIPKKTTEDSHTHVSVKSVKTLSPLSAGWS